MFRIHLIRLFVLGAATILVGCNSTGGGGLCNTCGDKPGLFSRFRTTSSSDPVVISSGEMVQGPVVNGPYMPPAQPPLQPGVLPSPTPNTAPIPPVDQNGKQYQWNPNMSSRPGTKTGNETRTVREGN